MYQFTLKAHFHIDVQEPANNSCFCFYADVHPLTTSAATVSWCPTPRILAVRYPSVLSYQHQDPHPHQDQDSPTPPQALPLSLSLCQLLQQAPSQEDHSQTLLLVLCLLTKVYIQIPGSTG